MDNLMSATAARCRSRGNAVLPAEKLSAKQLRQRPGSPPYYHCSSCDWPRSVPSECNFQRRLTNIWFDVRVSTIVVRFGPACDRFKEWYTRLPRQTLVLRRSTKAFSPISTIIAKGFKEQEPSSSKILVYTHPRRSMEASSRLRSLRHLSPRCSWRR